MALLTSGKCRELRLVLGLTQRQLAVAAGLRANYICRWENGEIANPSGEKIFRIISALHSFASKQRPDIVNALKEFGLSVSTEANPPWASDRVRHDGEFPSAPSRRTKMERENEV